MTFKSTGSIHYEHNGLLNEYKMYVLVDPNITNYYRILTNKACISNMVNKPRYPAHISVLRKETPANFDSWGRYNNQSISYEYDHYVYNDDVYWWLRVKSDKLCDIRMELGLDRHSMYSRPPDGVDFFHITIGNTK